MFTFVDMLDGTRELLNDTVTPYRYGNDLLEQLAKMGVVEIHRLNPDSRIDDDGGVYTSNDLFEYTSSS